jgi:hypothetical protein
MKCAFRDRRVCSEHYLPRTRGRALKIRQVFAELRSALCNEMPAIELLKFAGKLVDVWRAAALGDDEKVVTLRSNYPLPLDEAFADGGWSIMARDRAYDADQFEDDTHVCARAKSTLSRLMKRAA